PLRARLYPLSLHDALPIYQRTVLQAEIEHQQEIADVLLVEVVAVQEVGGVAPAEGLAVVAADHDEGVFQLAARLQALHHAADQVDRKSTRLNSSHVKISYA